MYQHLEYTAWGETFVEEHSNTDRTPYLFNGKELDEETGLYYYGARYYDARTSVWLSSDPMAEKFPTVSSYAYCMNNPLIFIDPTGMEIEGVSVVNGKDGKSLDMSGASDETKELLNAMMKTEEGKANALFLAETKTKVDLQATDELILIQNDDGTFSEGNSYMLPSDNNETPASATIIVSRANLGTEGSSTRSVDNEKDLMNAKLITFKNEYDMGTLSDNSKGIVTRDKIVKASASSSSGFVTGFEKIPLPFTGTTQGEMGAFSTHEARHLTRQNYRIRMSQGGRAGEADALKSESRYRTQYSGKTK